MRCVRVSLCKLDQHYGLPSCLGCFSLQGRRRASACVFCCSGAHLLAAQYSPCWQVSAPSLPSSHSISHSSTRPRSFNSILCRTGATVSQQLFGQSIRVRTPSPPCALASISNLFLEAPARLRRLPSPWIRLLASIYLRRFSCPCSFDATIDLDTPNTFRSQPSPFASSHARAQSIRQCERYPIYPSTHPSPGLKPELHRYPQLLRFCIGPS